VFAIVLTIGAVQVAGSTASSLFGYMVVWSLCGGGALVAALLLFAVPKLAFADETNADETDADPDTVAAVTAAQ